MAGAPLISLCLSAPIWLLGKETYLGLSQDFRARVPIMQLLWSGLGSGVLAENVCIGVMQVLMCNQAAYGLTDVQVLLLQ